jgi:feruloyl esterase
MGSRWTRYGLVSLLALVVAPAIAADCEGLAKLALPETTITTAQEVPAGSFTPPMGAPLNALPAFCRVAGVIKPSSDSNVQFEVWMPATGWNGKFQGIGNGGFAGSITFGGLADAMKHGYAAASTDTGHQAGATNAGWALGHPEKIIDFGYRAIHETTEKAKAIVQAFYGSGPRRSYFSSCSNGGRQALMEAQRYPADYDGIIAGAPANHWTHLLLNGVSDMQATAGGTASYIPSSKLPAIQAAALAACDPNDGVRDSVIENPGQCRFDPAALLCQGPESDRCLTAPQVKALKKIYDGTRNGKGELLSPGYSPGGEAESGGWEPWITGQAPEQSLLFAFGTGFYRNMVYNDPAWDYKTFNVDRDAKAAIEKTARVLNATDPNLKRFQARGGKLILYHGWSDAAIPAQSTINYYESVVKKMGAKNSGSFVRLYMVPGMQHCAGGSGPSSFGQWSVAQGDARTNVAAALERWVEQGLAPDEIIATKYKSGADPASGVARTRLLCPYPMVARYKGTGSTDEAASFECVVPAMVK